MKKIFAPLLTLIFLPVSIIFLVASTAAQSENTRPRKVAAPVQSSQPNPADKKAQVATIDKFVAEIERTKKNKNVQRKIFATIDSGKKGTREVWLEFKSDKAREQADTGDNLNENAFVWLRDKNVLTAAFTLQSASRDWAHYVYYYFRSDGSLAKIDAELLTFNGDVRVIRARYFAANGQEISSSKKFFPLKGNKEIKPPKDFIDKSYPLYKKQAALPFYRQLFAVNAPAKKK